jgi:hypothetical protein
MLRELLILTGGLALASGCVEQTLTVTSKPSGAIVYLNNVEFGRTPITRQFTSYGTYDVAVRREGYETLKTDSVVIAPIWNWVPLDLAATFLPIPFKDRQRLDYVLTPASTQPADDLKLVDRAKVLEHALPATRPVAGTTY